MPIVDPRNSTFLALARRADESLKIGDDFIGISSISGNLVTLKIYASGEILTRLFEKYEEYEPALNSQHNILTMRLYPDEYFDLRDGVRVAVLKKNGKIKIGVNAPNEDDNRVDVTRSELLSDSSENRTLNIWGESFGEQIEAEPEPTNTLLEIGDGTVIEVVGIDPVTGKVRLGIHSSKSVLRAEDL